LLNWHPSFMLNAHPLFVHYPIALWTAPIILVVLGLIFRKPWLETAGAAALVLGTALAFFTAGTGLHAAWTAPHPEAAHEILEDHETLAFTSFGLAAVLSIWRLAFWQRSGRLHFLFPVALLALFVLVSFTGDRGGRLVYRFGVGTTAVKLPSEWSHEYEVTHGEKAGHPAQPEPPAQHR
jgi:uncharacterized membrane protein